MKFLMLSILQWDYCSSTRMIVLMVNSWRCGKTWQHLGNLHCGELDAIKQTLTMSRHKAFILSCLHEVMYGTISAVNITSRVTWGRNPEKAATWNIEEVLKKVLFVVLTGHVIRCKGIGLVKGNNPGKHIVSRAGSSWYRQNESREKNLLSWRYHILLHLHIQNLNQDWRD